MDLVIQLASGAIGGLGAGKALPKYSQGNLVNVIAGLVGGGVGGQILSQLLGTAVGGGGMDIASILGNVASSGVGGGLLIVIIGVIKNLLKK